MKKSMLSKIILLFSVLTPLIFTSCDDVIFSEIRDEVKLSEAKVSGDVKSIIRYGNYIYITNGDVFVKDPSITVRTSWVQMLSPEGSPYDLAADANYLYAVSILYVDSGNGYNIPTYRYLSCYKDGSWTTVRKDVYSSSTEYVLFCTNTPQVAHRHAYLRIGTTVYQLDGSTLTDISSTSGTTANSCTVLGDDKVVFSAANDMTSNETASTNSTKVYLPASSFVGVSTDGSNYNYVSLGTETIISIAYTADYLVVGTEEGIAHSPLTDGVPYFGTVDYISNADSALSSYYQIWALFFADPSKSEYENVAFASTDFEGSSSSTSASTSNIGLWGYYPTTYEWNRE